MATSSQSLGSAELSFLRRRVAYAGLWGALIGFGFVLLRLGLSLAADVAKEAMHPSMLAHVAGSLAFLAGYFLTRRTKRSVAFVRGVEWASFFVGCAFWVVMGYTMPVHARPELVVALALTMVAVTRAVYVPSSARRTLLVTASVGVPLLMMTFALYSAADLARWEAVDPAIARRSNPATAGMMTVFEAGWWAATTLVCTLASRVIYGLRREVKSAKKLGQYTLEERLGQGGMGVVYRASHALLRRPTAVKLLLPDKAGSSNLARFEREVQLTARLSHPNTITVFDYGRTPDGVFYYAMELLDGATLSEVLEEGGPLPPARVARILGDVAGALGEAHSIGLIHRDIKPANVMLCERGGIPDVVKVLDFGLVKEVERGEGDGLTQADAITGTPQYMAPEAIRDPDSVDARSDIYALGAVAYYLLTGVQVFDGASIVEVCSHHLHTKPVPPSERLGSALPPDLESLVLDCLAKDRAARPRDASAFAERLAGACGAGEWSKDDARRWWAEHGRALAQRRKGSAPTEGGTLAVDLAHRETVSV
jgi:serine/threonine-protein kinase